MVCLSDAANIQATVRDKSGLSHRKSYTMELYRDKKVDTVFSEIAYEFRYDINSVELMTLNNQSGQSVILNQHKGKTLEEAGVSFADNRISLIITMSKHTNKSPFYKGMNFDDDIQLGASASPTAPKSFPNPEPELPILYDARAGGNSSRDPQTSFPAIEAANHRLQKSPPVCNYVGLVNQAMTCYLNSLLQALYMTPEFRNALYNWEFDGSNPGNSIPFQLQRLFLNLQTSPKSAVETTDLTHSFGWNMQQAWEQHDIQELCRVMFDALEQRFKDTKQANLINDLYEGKMFDYVKCLECSTEKSREDTFQDIPLPVRPFGSTVAYNSVEEALRAFVQPETLEGNNQYHCETCDKKCDAHKGLKFTKFPYLLTLHLKRFDFDYSTMNRIKLNDKVVFPEVLNLNSFIPGSNACADEPMEERETVVKCDDCSTTDSGSALDDEGCQGNDVSSTNGPDDNCQDDDEGIDVSSGNNHHENEKNRLQEPKGPYIYELFSIMIHSGSASGGHYYAYIKDFSKNQWFCFNDQSVSPVTEDDIHKTYGGGPQRGYYSGAYTSSTNAYMLMYRQIDKERNCQALTVDEFPEHIKKLLRDMREKEEADRIKKEQEIEEIETYKIKVYCQDPDSVQNVMMQQRVLVFVDTTLAETTAEVHEKFKLKGVVNLEDCRLVAYNKTMECIEHSFESNDLQFGEVTKKCTEFLLQIKKPNTVFEDYKVDGVEMKVFVINLETEEVENPTTIWVNPGETVGELKKRLGQIHNLDTVHIVQETYTNPLQHLDCDEVPVRFDPRCHGYKLYVSRHYDMEDPEKPFHNSKLASVIDRFVHIISLEIALPDTDIGTLEQLSIPSLDVNQNLDRIEIGAGDSSRASNPSSLRVSPQPGPVGCEMFSDQSNSEDSSLSDSDRTLVGDAPGDNIGLLSSSSNSPADQHMASPTEPNDEDYPESCVYYQKYNDRMLQDEECSPSNEECAAQAVTAVDYYFKASPIEARTADSRCCRVLVDKRITLGRLKRNLQTIVGVPMDYFKIYRLYPNQDIEWSTLTDTLGSIKDGERLFVKLGRVLKNNELSGKIYFLDPNGAEPVTFWFEWIIAEDQTVASVKKEILLQAKKQYLVDIPFSKCRLRKKTISNPSNIYLDEEKFSENIVITRNFEMFVQEITGPEKTNSSQMILFVRLWQPSKLELGPFQEIRLEERTMDSFKKAVSALSNIPLEFLEVASVKSSFPADMHVLEIHTNLDWNPDKYFIENFSFEVYDDGCILFYRDSRENLKTLTMDERKELLHSENKRLGRFCKKNYSPRRERGLKIYVDTSPKIEDEVFLD